MVGLGWVAEQIESGHLKLGEITDKADLAANLAENAIPEFIWDVSAENYREFLTARRKLMAGMIRDYYEGL